MDTTSPNPDVLPEISEEELDRMKCAQRREQNQQWEQMSEEQRKEIRETLFPAGTTELEPLVGAELQ